MQPCSSVLNILCRIATVEIIGIMLAVILLTGLEKVSKRLVPSGGFKFLVTKVVLDSAVMGSLYVAAFFAFSSLVLEGSGWQGVVQKMKVGELLRLCGCADP